MIARFSFGLGILGSVLAAAHPASAQQTGCQYFQVTAPSLNVFTQPRGDTSFVAALAKSDFVCVVGEQDVTGDRTWVHIAAKVAAKGQTVVMDGWAIKSALQSASANDVAALTAPTSAPSSPALPSPASAARPSVDSSSQPPVTFDGIITEGPTPVNGASLAQLVQGVPEFPPIDGLPDEAWKKTCNTCHQWNKQSLCVQAKIYADDPKMALRKQHPFGGSEKVAMMKWAQGGCQ